VVQLLLAIGLLKWGVWQEHHPPGSFDTAYVATPTFACEGINAPAVFLGNVVRAVAPPRRANEAVSDKLLGGYNLSFLLGVIILWYLVGRGVDRRISRSAGAQTTVGARVSQALQVIVGICLLPIGIGYIGSGARLNNALGNTLSGTLFLAWSLVLIALPGATLVKAIRRRHLPREETQA
jgi:hypothetical protein